MSANVYQKRVKDIVSRDTVTVSAEDTVHEALTLMGENRVSFLPVVDHLDRCIGILSASDLIDMTRDVDDDLRQLDLVDPISKKFLLDKLTESLGSEQVQAFMTESVTSVEMETPIGLAAMEMVRSRVHHLPVVGENNHLLGIISTMDVLRAFAESAPKSALV